MFNTAFRLYTLGGVYLASASAKLSDWAAAEKGDRRKEGAGEGRRVLKGTGDRDEDERLSDAMMLSSALSRRERM